MTWTRIKHELNNLCRRFNDVDRALCNESIIYSHFYYFKSRIYNNSIFSLFGSNSFFLYFFFAVFYFHPFSSIHRCIYYFYCPKICSASFVMKFVYGYQANRSPKRTILQNIRIATG